MTFESVALAEEPDHIAPDGIEVRLLAGTSRGSMAHFTVEPHAVSRAVTHRTVDELWTSIGGEGEMWLADAQREEIVSLRPGVSVSVPLGSRFQVRNLGPEPLTFVGVTMPPWPGPQEAIVVDGRWPPTIG